MPAPSWPSRSASPNTSVCATTRSSRFETQPQLHDIGKVGIPDAILLKPGPLDPDELEFIRRHTIIGERIVSAAPALAAAASIIRSSHERYDGTGYPDRLSADQIPIGSQIIFVCDAFDVMTSHRPYKDACEPKLAMAEIHRCSGSQFNPVVVEALEAVLARPVPEQETRTAAA
jgi:two-component system, cell cycle response regulator